MEILALTIGHNRPSLAGVLGTTSWVVNECSLWVFSTKNNRILSLPLNISNSPLRGIAKHLSGQVTEVTSDRFAMSKLYIFSLLCAWSVGPFCSFAI